MQFQSKQFIKILFISIFFISAYNIQAQDGYKVTLKVKGKTDSSIILGNYWADRTVAFDTGYYNAKKKEWVFEGNEKAPRGVYFMIFRDMSHFEFVMNDKQHFSISTDTVDFYTKNLTFEGSDENNRFAKYQQTTGDFGMRLYAINGKMASAADEIEKKKLVDERNALNDERTAYMENFLKENPNDILCKILGAMRPVDVPEIFKADGKTIDTMVQYQYYKSHYWDNFDFKEEALIRSPQNFVFNKINTFFLSVIPQHPDSIIDFADNILKQTNGNRELDKYFIFRITQIYDTLQMMCMDKPFVYLVDNYYLKGRAFWADSATLERMKEAADKRRYTVCGEIALDLNHYDMFNKAQRLYEHRGSKYTIIVFYDPTCGHCRTELPILHKIYEEKKKEGWGVYAIATSNKKTEWEKYIKEENPTWNDWTNVCDVVPYQEWVDNRKAYNITANPTIMLLDSKGKIIARKIPAENILEFVERYEKAPEKFR